MIGSPPDTVVTSQATRQSDQQRYTDRTVVCKTTARFAHFFWWVKISNIFMCKTSPYVLNDFLCFLLLLLYLWPGDSLWIALKCRNCLLSLSIIMHPVSLLSYKFVTFTATPGGSVIAWTIFHLVHVDHTFAKWLPFHCQDVLHCFLRAYKSHMFDLLFLTRVLISIRGCLSFVVLPHPFQGSAEAAAVSLASLAAG